MRFVKVSIMCLGLVLILGFVGYSILQSDLNSDETILDKKPRISFLIATVSMDSNLQGIDIEGIDIGETFFNVYDKGFAHRISWPQNGYFLVFDLNKNGKVDGSQELLSASVDGKVPHISSLDDNNDGVLSSGDKSWENVFLWQDIDGLFRKFEGVMYPVKDVGIEEIKLTVQPYDKTFNTIKVKHRVNMKTKYGDFLLYDFSPEIDPADTYYYKQYSINWDTLNFPTLRGYGTLPDLHVAMSLDHELLKMMDELVLNAKQSNELNRKAFQDLLFRWAKVENIPRDSRGPYVDARELGFLEAMMGERFNNKYSGHTPRKGAGTMLKSMYMDTYLKKYEQVKVQIFKSDERYDLHKDEIITVQ